MFFSWECLCCQLEVSATDRSILQRSSTTAVCVSMWSRENKQPRHLLWVGGRRKDYERTSVFPCQFGSVCAPLHGKRKKLIISITGLHNKAEGCGVSVASAVGPSPQTKICVLVFNWIRLCLNRNCRRLK
jgi:hypothetical protein